MATPVTDLRPRLRNAGVSEEQADAISGAFESLSSQINDLSSQIRIVILGQRIQLGLLLLVAAAILAPTLLPGAIWPDDRFGICGELRDEACRRRAGHDW